MSGVGTCLGDTISTGSPSETYSLGTPIDALELAQLGIDPNLFLFTGNTMYNGSENYLLNIIGAPIDPSTTGSLNGTATQNVIVNLTGSGGSVSGTNFQSSPSTPEPSTAFLFALGCILTLASFGVQAHRAGRSLAWSSTNSATDNSSARRPRSAISPRISRG